ncbi:MAG: flagellar basal body rod protein FlgC [Phycisphaerae bacterium]
MFGALEAGTSALVAQRIRMDTIAGNVQNVSTTQRADGEPGPYRRRVALFATGDGRGQPGVHVAEIIEDPSPLRRVHEPGHPMADSEGYVWYPNVDPSVEMVNMIEAARAYEANVTAMEVTKSMMASTLRLLA